MKTPFRHAKNKPDPDISSPVKSFSLSLIEKSKKSYLFVSCFFSPHASYLFKTIGYISSRWWPLSPRAFLLIPLNPASISTARLRSFQKTFQHGFPSDLLWPYFSCTFRSRRKSGLRDRCCFSYLVRLFFRLLIPFIIFLLIGCYVAPLYVNPKIKCESARCLDLCVVACLWARSRLILLESIN